MKSPLESKGIWGVLIALGAYLCGEYNIDIGENELSQLYIEFGEAIGMAVAFYGRVKASGPIQLVKPKVSVDGLSERNIAAVNELIRKLKKEG